MYGKYVNMLIQSCILNRINPDFFAFRLDRQPSSLQEILWQSYINWLARNHAVNLLYLLYFTVFHGSF